MTAAPEADAATTSAGSPASAPVPAPALAPAPGGAKPSEGQSAARDAGIFVYSRIAASALDFVAFVLAARLLPRTDTGFAFLAYALMVYYTAIALGSIGLPDSVFYFLGRRPREGGAVVRQTSLLLGAAFVPVIAVIAVLVFLGSPSVDLRGSFHWIVLILALELPTQPAVNLLIAGGQARLASGFFVLFAAARATAIVLPAALGLEARWVLPGLAAGGAIRLVVHLWVVRRFFAWREVWLKLGELRAILYFAVPAGVAAICGTLNAQIDKYFVALVLGAEAMADYAVGSWEVPLVTLLPYAIGSILQPRYVRLHLDGRREDLLALWHETVRTTALIVLPISILLIVLAPDLIVLVFSSKYERAFLPFQIYTVILLHRVASYGAMLQAVGDTKSLLVSSVLMVGTNAVIDYPFLVWLGFSGAALATVLSNVPAFAYTLRRLSVGLGVPLRRVMPWRAYFATLLASVATGAGLWLLLRALALPHWANVVLGIPLHLGATFALCRALRLVRDEDVAYLRRWLAFKLLREE